MEEYTTEVQETKSEQAKRWFQDNLRIVISIAIVVLIAGGIYSYSKRSESPAVTDESASTTQQATDNNSVTDNGSTPAATDQKAAPATKVAPNPTASSKETESAFVETAGRGDGATHLARRALANYLEKNPDSALTKEHKIYIEDYLRKTVSPGQRVSVGASIDYSKDAITKAIELSKTLNEKQLKNLQKYSARVSSL